MYPYHNRIKQRIQAGELVDYYYTEDYPRIGQALVLVFSTAPMKRPIRPHRWAEYQSYLADYPVPPVTPEDQQETKTTRPKAMK